MKISSTNDNNREQECLNNLASPCTFSQPITRSTRDALCTKYNLYTQFIKVLIIGLGQLGLPASRYVNEKGFDTYD